MLCIYESLDCLLPCLSTRGLLMSMFHELRSAFEKAKIVLALEKRLCFLVGCAQVLVMLANKQPTTDAHMDFIDRAIADIRCVHDMPITTAAEARNFIMDRVGRRIIREPWFHERMAMLEKLLGSVA